MGRGRVIVMVQSTYGLPTRPLRVASPTIPNENFNDYRLASENGRPMEPTPEMKSLIIMTIPGPSIKHRSVSAVGHEKYSKVMCKKKLLISVVYMNLNKHIDTFIPVQKK
eukprot:346329_1